MTKIKNIIGERFSRLQVLEYVEQNKNHHSIWKCLCDCGKSLNVCRPELISGDTKSCGCFKADVCKNNRTVYFNEDFFENIDSEEKAYWLGFIAADGNISKNLKRVSLYLKSSDYEHILKFIRNIDSKNVPTRKVDNNATGMFGVDLNSIKMVTDLINKGVFPKKSLIISPYSLNETLEKHYWRGLLDGDGSIYLINNKKCLNLCGTYNMCNGLRIFLNKNNIQSNSKIYKKGNIFTTILNGNNIVQSICKLLYEDTHIYLNRKYKLAMNIK